MSMFRQQASLLRKNRSSSDFNIPRCDIECDRACHAENHTIITHIANGTLKRANSFSSAPIRLSVEMHRCTTQVNIFVSLIDLDQVPLFTKLAAFVHSMLS